MTSSKFKKRIGLSFVFGLLCVGTAAAQVMSADEYFHRGATNYIFGQMQQAKTVVEAGLREYTNDFKLKSLYEKLKQKEQQDQQQSKDEESKNDKKEEQKSDSKPKQKDRSKQDEQQQQQENQKPDPQSQEQKQSEKKGDEEAQKKDREGQSEDEKARPIQMTPQEAQRLLDALKSQEKAMIFIPPKTNRANRIFKDW